LEERVWEARRQWPEIDPANLEQLDRRGRLFRDAGTGLTYRRVNGTPLLDLYSQANKAIAAFTVLGKDPGRIIFLKPADHEEGSFVYVGEVVGRQVTAGPSQGPGIL
jgi:hypothetical protein